MPLEDQLSGIEGLSAMRSKSVAQLSSIRLIFGHGTDELRARQLVAERIAQVTATLPTWASPPFMMPALSSTSRIMKIGLTSDVRESDRPVDDRLLEDPRPPAAGPRCCAGRHLGRAAPTAARPRRPGEARRVRRPAPGGDGRRGGRARGRPASSTPRVRSWEPAASSRTIGQRFNIRHVQPITGPAELGAVPVVERDGKVLRLADMGEVVIDHGPLIGDAVINDGPGIMLVVQKFRGANTLEVTRGVEAAMNELGRRVCPASPSTRRSSDQRRSSSSRSTISRRRC